MKIIIPIQLQKITTVSEINIQSKTVGEALKNLCYSFPELEARIYKEKVLNKFINVFVNEDDIKFLAGEETVVKDSDTLIIVPAIAGG